MHHRVNIINPILIAPLSSYATKPKGDCCYVGDEESIQD